MFRVAYVDREGRVGKLRPYLRGRDTPGNLSCERWEQSLVVGRMMRRLRRSVMVDTGDCVCAGVVHVPKVMQQAHHVAPQRRRVDQSTVGIAAVASARLG